MENGNQIFSRDGFLAANEHGGFGKWTWAVSKNPADVKEIIEKIMHA